MELKMEKALKRLLSRDPTFPMNKFLPPQRLRESIPLNLNRPKSSIWPSQIDTVSLSIALLNQMMTIRLQLLQQLNVLLTTPLDVL